jgi:hypothetical protein
MIISFPKSGDCGFRTTSPLKSPVCAFSPVRQRRRKAKSIDLVFIAGGLEVDSE